MAMGPHFHEVILHGADLGIRRRVGLIVDGFHSERPTVRSVHGGEDRFPPVINGTGCFMPPHRQLSYGETARLIASKKGTRP